MTGEHRALIVSDRPRAAQRQRQPARFHPPGRGMTHRRAFLASLGAALAFRPVGALGQATAKPPRIGWLTSSVVHTRNVEAFKQEMEVLGYRHISIEVRAAEGKMDHEIGRASCRERV